MHNKIEKSQSKEKIHKLIEQFESEFGTSKNPSKKEAQLEDKYVKPLFAALNWNIHNEGLAVSEEEFIVQASEKSGGSYSEPDYLLRVPDKASGLMRKVLFMEAKDPKYDLSTNITYIRQAYKYAHNTLNKTDHTFNRVRLSVLTDFEEFRMFDCFDPFPLTKNDPLLFKKYIVKPFDFHYKDYIAQFDAFWETFERDNVYNGSLDNYKVTKEDLISARMSPDMSFLAKLREWREDVAKSLFNNNHDLSDEFLTAASELFINRIVFIKMLADRNIEKDYLTELLDIVKKKEDGKKISLYEECRNIFTELDKKYNGSIFAYRREFDESFVDNKKFISIFEELRPEKSIYTLAAMPTEIIGNIYEEFLGEVVVHKGTGIKIEQKPAVQQAGGVYYTPRYIVEYILSETLQKKLDACNSPSAVSKIKVLDPACGSGSFLIAAFDMLIRWHENFYTTKVRNEIKTGLTIDKIRQKYRQEVTIRKVDTGFRLTLTSKLKKDILLNTIFGIDVDKNAVEIAQFSLSMKILERVTHQEVHEDIDLFNERILPDLTANIKCGNSLISTDIFGLFPDLDTEKIKTINPFDWAAKGKMNQNGQVLGSGFPEVMKNGGFDCIIGNPPYITFALGRGRMKTENVDHEYLIKTWPNSCSYKINSFALFYELATTKIREKGVVGFIVPGTILINESLSQIRRYLLEKKMIHKFIKLDYKVFEGAEMGDCAILFLSNDNAPQKKAIKTAYAKQPSELFGAKTSEIDTKDALGAPDIRLFLTKSDYQKIKTAENLVELGKVAKFYNGIKTGDNKKFLADKKVSKEWVPAIRGRDFAQYTEPVIEKYVLFDKNKLWSNHNEAYLGKRPKIIVRQTGDTITATLETKGHYPMDTVHMLFDSTYDLKLLLAILNSKSFNDRHRALVPEDGKAFAEVKIANLKKIFIPMLNSISDQDSIIQHVDDLLLLHKQLAAESQEAARETIIRKIMFHKEKVEQAVSAAYGDVD